MIFIAYYSYKRGARGMVGLFTEVPSAPPREVLSIELQCAHELAERSREASSQGSQNLPIHLITRVPAVRAVLGETPTLFLNPCFTISAPEIPPACRDTLDHIFRQTEQIG